MVADLANRKVVHQRLNTPHSQLEMHSEVRGKIANRPYANRKLLPTTISEHFQQDPAKQLNQAPFLVRGALGQALETYSAVREGDHSSDSRVWDGGLVHPSIHVRLDAHHLGGPMDNERE